MIFDINVGSVDPSDIRAAGWAVAVHNDYMKDGRKWTFWLFTKNNLAVKGEAQSDNEALDIVRVLIVCVELLLKSELEKLTADQRLDVFSKWCKYCGTESPCTCMRDE